MQVQVAALCDSAADYGGKLCMIGAFDTIGVRNLPATHPHCSIALRIVFHDQDQGKHQLRVTMIDEDGRNLLPRLEPNMDVRMPENLFFVSMNMVFSLQGLKFEKAGHYSIDVSLDNNIIARIPLQVVQLPPQGQGQPPPGPQPL
ncbi:MAG TPA: hypothetical protein VGH19_15635 [Verrucomicrobiae bacterium]